MSERLIQRRKVDEPKVRTLGEVILRGDVIGLDGAELFPDPGTEESLIVNSDVNSDVSMQICGGNE